MKRFNSHKLFAYYCRCTAIVGFLGCIALGLLLIGQPHLHAQTSQPPPIVAFTTLPQPAQTDTLFICEGQTVSFIDQSQNVNSYHWQFGDGGSSDVSNPTHTYHQAGTYLATLQANYAAPTFCYAEDDVFYTEVNVPINLIDVLNNDYCIDEYSSIELISISGVGVSGTTFSSPYCGTFVLTYLICNQYGACDEGTITIIVPCDCCEAVTDVYTTELGMPIDIMDVLYNDDYCTTEFSTITISGVDVNEDIIFFPPNSGTFVLTYFICNLFYSCCDEGTLTIIVSTGGSPDGLSAPISDRTVASPPTQMRIERHSERKTIDNLANRLYRNAHTTTDSLVIVVEPSQSPPISCSGTVCAGDTVWYSTSAVCSDYYWEVTGAQSFDWQGTEHIVVIWGDGPMGTVSLQTSNCNGNVCSSPNVVQVPILQSIAQMSGDTLICPWQISQYEVPYINGGIFEWSIQPPTAGVLINTPYTNNAMVQWLEPPLNSMAQVLVEYRHDLANCAGSASLNVYAKREFTIGASATRFCVGDIATISSSLAGNYYWTVSGGNIISGQNSNAIQVGWTNEGTHTITAAATQNTVCNETASTTISVLPPLDAPNAIVGTNLVCPQQTYTYSTLPISQENVQLYWEVLGGSIVSGQNTPNVQILWGDVMPYQLSLYIAYNVPPTCPSEIVSFAATSLSDTTMTVTGNSNICINGVASYSTTPLIANSLYEWTITPAEAGTVISGQGTPLATIQWNTTAQTAFVAVNNCSLAAGMNVVLHEVLPPNIAQDMALCVGSSATLSVPAIYSSYSWYNEIGSLLGIEPTLNISEQGVYRIMVSDEYGCTTLSAIDVLEKAIPIVNISTTDDWIMCNTEPHNVTMESLLQIGVGYQWLLNNSAITGATGPVYTHIGTAELGNDLYSVQATDSLTGCTALSNLIEVFTILCTGSDSVCAPNLCVLPDDHIPAEYTRLSPECSSTVEIEAFAGDALFTVLSFGDGTPTTANNGSLTHTYEFPGIYRITYTAFYQNLAAPPSYCVDKFIDIIRIPLTAFFETEGQCVGSPIIFYDRSAHVYTTQITTWEWDFGDGSPLVVGMPNATHQYNTAGDYTVTLTISNDTCSTQFSRLITVHTLPEAGFEAIPIACEGNVLQFLPNNNTWTSYLWQLGTGDSSWAIVPSYTYTDSGNYIVSLQVSNEYACWSAPYIDSLTVIPLVGGVISATDTVLCAGESAWLTAPTGIAYEWSTGQTDATIEVETSGFYWVKVIDDNNCYYNTPAIEVIAHELPPTQLNPMLTASDTLHICAGEEQTFCAPTGYLYNWSNGTSSHCISIENGQYAVTISDAQTSCAATAITPTVITHSLPNNPSITPLSITLCEGETIYLSANHSSLSNFIWNTGQVGPQILVANSGMYVVTVSDAYGCKASSSAFVDLFPTPDADILPTGCYEICLGDTLTVPLIPNIAYQWYLNGTPISTTPQNSLVVTQSGEYTLSMSNWYGCEDESGVLELEVLPACNPITLPISLLSFWGKIAHEGNYLEWVTASETNNAYFTLMRSTDNELTFHTIATLPSMGNSSSQQRYNYWDKQLLNVPTYYYRLTQTDFDGQSKEAGYVVLNREQQGNYPDKLAIERIVPIPLQDNLHLYYYSPQAQFIELTLYDMLGRCVIKQQVEANKGSNYYTYPTQQLYTGWYVIKIDDGHTAATAKIVK